MPFDMVWRDTEDEMILRLWRGWTKPENADRYEELIRATIFPGIAARTIAGLEGLELFRRQVVDEVEFMTLMQFQSMGGGQGVRRSKLGSVRRTAGCAHRACPLRREGDPLRAARRAR